MRADELKLNELVDFSEGLLHLHGRRLVLHDMHAFAQTRQDLFAMVGRENTRRILTRFGYFWGQADAAAMKRIFSWENTREWLKAGPRLHTLQGVVRAEVKTLTWNEGTGAFQMDVVWHDSGEALEHLAAAGVSNEPVCWMLAGYASGYASFCLGKDIYFIETACRASGARACRATGKDRTSWGDILRPHLTFFEAGDIQGKILQLSKELRERTRELSRERERLEQLISPLGPGFAEVKSASFRRVLDMATRSAPYGSAILITGESGVGKEILARHIHRLSPRAKGPFLAVNCSALPEALLESELFGHKAGAFTGAIRDRKGLFEESAGGTLFLDEIGDVTPALQVKLLRAIEQKEIRSVGENRSRKVDVRIVSATNRNLPAAIRDGRFREDLYYRLGVIEIEIPPLRERREDILPLARLFVSRLAKKLNQPKLRLDATAFRHLLNFDWPGNVRELENALERAAVLSSDGVILSHHLPPAVSGRGPSRAGEFPTALSLEEITHRHIRAVLESMNGNRTEAARRLGISPATLWRKTKRD